MEAPGFRVLGGAPGPAGLPSGVTFSVTNRQNLSKPGGRFANVDICSIISDSKKRPELALILLIVCTGGYQQRLLCPEVRIEVGSEP
jgi:hypothetical protein